MELKTFLETSYNTNFGILKSIYKSLSYNQELFRLAILEKPDQLNLKDISSEISEYFLYKKTLDNWDIDFLTNHKSELYPSTVSKIIAHFGLEQVSTIFEPKKQTASTLMASVNLLISEVFKANRHHFRDRGILTRLVSDDFVHKATAKMINDAYSIINSNIELFNQAKQKNLNGYIDFAASLYSQDIRLCDLDKIIENNFLNNSRLPNLVLTVPNMFLMLHPKSRKIMEATIVNNDYINSGSSAATLAKIESNIEMILFISFYVAVYKDNIPFNDFANSFVNILPVIKSNEKLNNIFLKGGMDTDMSTNSDVLNLIKDKMTKMKRTLADYPDLDLYFSQTNPETMNLVISDLEKHIINLSIGDAKNNKQKRGIKL